MIYDTFLLILIDPRLKLARDRRILRRDSVKVLGIISRAERFLKKFAKIVV